MVITARPTSDPALGPRILFFSGGTALRGLSRLLPGWTERSIHLVTPFDSGGSSAALRRALGMPAVGDLRNRILALADVASPQGRAVHDRHLAAELADGSVVASLLPGGIGEAVAASPAPKLYLPNAGGDPEERGWSLDVIRSGPASAPPPPRRLRTRRP
jgi:2-phospho-L-lactate transferase/gluconeogenesis factor (CofD/UPF0052 family)